MQPFEPPPPSLPYVPPPVRTVNWIAIAGGVIVFVSFIAAAVAGFAYADVNQATTEDQFRSILRWFAIADVVGAFGFLLAFLGLSIRRN